MLLIKDLGQCPDTINLSTGNVNHRHMGLFKCPDCNQTFKLRWDRGHKQQRCQPCAARHSQTTHGKSDHPLYELWQDLKKRCYNPKHRKYKNYGAKGITVSGSWKDNFKQFYDDNINAWEPGLGLELIEPEKGYSKENTRWIPVKELTNKAKYKRPVVQLLPGSPMVKVTEYESIVEASKKTGISTGAIRSCLTKRTKSSGKFVWLYKDEYESCQK